MEAEAGVPGKGQKGGCATVKLPGAPALHDHSRQLPYNELSQGLDAKFERRVPDLGIWEAQSSRGVNNQMGRCPRERMRCVSGHREREWVSQDQSHTGSLLGKRGGSDVGLPSVSGKQELFLKSIPSPRPTRNLSA